MYGSSTECIQCRKQEEGQTHVFIECDFSNIIYSLFCPLLKKILNIDISKEEKAFGLQITDFNQQKRERLRNYIFCCIKHVIFRHRAKNVDIPFSDKSVIIYQKIKTFISIDLQGKFFFAKNNNRVQRFKNIFLIDNILGELNLDQSLQINI